MNRPSISFFLGCLALAACGGANADLGVTKSEPLGSLEKMKKYLNSPNLIIKPPADADVPELNVKATVYAYEDDRANSKTDTGGYMAWIYADDKGKVLKVEGRYLMGYTGSAWSILNDFLVAYWKQLGGPENPPFGPLSNSSAGGSKSYTLPNPAVDASYTIMNMDNLDKVKSHRYKIVRKG